MGAYEDAAGSKAQPAIVVVQIKIGSTTTFYTRHHATILGIDGPIEGRALSFGTLDREMTDGGPVIGDVTVRFANTDGGFDDFLAELSDTDKNLIRADVRFFRGFAGLNFSDYRQVGRTQFAELQDQGLGFADVHFTDRENDKFGDVITPKADVVLKLIAEKDTDFAGFKIRFGEESRVVQIAAGQFFTDYLGLPNDCLQATPSATVEGDFGERFVYLVAISPFDFATTDEAFDHFWLDFENAPIHQDGNTVATVAGQTLKTAGNWSFWEFPSVAPNGNSVGELKTIDLTAEAGYHVLVVLVDSFPAGLREAAPNIRIGMAQDIDGAGRPWLNPIEMMRSVLNAHASHPNRWIDGFVDVDGTIADTELRVNGFRGRVVVSQTTTAIEYVKRVARDFGIDLFYNRFGELAAFVLPFEGGNNPTYPSAPRFTVGEHFLRESMAAYRGADGQRNGLLNRLTIKVRFPWHGGPIGSVNQLRGLGSSGENLIDTRDKIPIEVVNRESEQKHERSIAITIDSDLHDYAGTARKVALRRTSRQGDPRYVTVQDFGLEGTIVDLSEIVQLTRPFPKGFDLGRFGVVEKIRDDLDNDVITLEVADYHDDLTAKPYILGIETEFVKDSGSGSKLLAVTASSVTLAFTGVDFSLATGSDIKTNDIVGCRLEKADRVGGDNEFVAVINTVVDNGGGSWTVTIKPASGGDEFGQRPDTTESSIQDWRILESDDTSATSRDVFGKLADSLDSEPSARAGHTMTASTIGELYLFGGLGDDGNVRNDLWKWNGSNWTQLAPTGGPPPVRVSHAAYHDAGNDNIYVHGGEDQSSTRLDDIWRYDVILNTWTDVTPGTKPSARRLHAFAEEVFGQEDAILFGGDTSGGNDSETWRWDPTLELFTLLSPATSPGARNDHAMAVTNQPTSKVVLFGGNDGSIDGETWEWNGTTWTLLSPTTSPTARQGHAMVFDDDDRVIRMICGQTGSLAFNLSREVWEWSGTDWSLKGDLVAPGAFREIAIAYDTLRKTILMMGGIDGGGGLRPETFILDMNRRSWRPLVVDRTKTLLGGTPPYTYADY